MDKVEKKAFLCALLFLAFILFIGWKFRSRNFYYAMDICEVLLLVAILKVSPLLELSINDLIVMESVMLLNKMILPFLYLPDYSHPRVIPFVFLLSLELYIQMRLMRKREHGYGSVIAYAAASCLIAISLLRKCGQVLYSHYFVRKNEISRIQKVLYMLVLIFIISVLIFLAIRYIGILVKRWLQTIQEYSMKYKEIDRSIMLVMSLTFCCLMMTDLVPMSAEGTYALPLLWICMCTVIVVIQIIYIRLLVKSILVKEEMRLQENDLQQIAEYNYELENNMENIRNIKHDIKNLFLTMGGFVDKSDDEEMKMFYAENIIPFAKQELQKNDLYMKLSNIYDESMKSFLYFKIMQGIEQDVDMDLQVQLDNTDNSFCMGQIDLIRILGILLDNAIEEAKTCNGTVVISIKEDAREYVFSISNTVRRQTKEKGVIAGTTDKGLGRGNGLLIANKLICKYKNVLLNSFFKEDKFVQCLRIEKPA
ncbi:MAG: GHKL domain-containing protein [Ruminococcus flavefaciens]|nr:GHKL domain-containing protein [Ruminococcus flavefaciens]